MATSTKKAKAPLAASAPASVPLAPLTIPELQTLLIKHYGLHEGKFDLMFELQFTAGAVGPSPESALPGAMIGFSKIGLSKAPAESKRAMDAAVVNPAPKQVKNKA